jgi:hypothetical protein
MHLFPSQRESRREESWQRSNMLSMRRTASTRVSIESNRGIMTTSSSSRSICLPPSLPLSFSGVSHLSLFPLRLSLFYSLGCATNSAYSSSGRSLISNTVSAMICLDFSGGNCRRSFMGLVFIPPIPSSRPKGVSLEERGGMGRGKARGGGEGETRTKATRAPRHASGGVGR